MPESEEDIKIGEIVKLMTELSEEARLGVMFHFCQFCGTSDLPCVCMRDE